MDNHKPTDESSNWIKGSMGLNITKTGVCERVVDIWKREMESWPSEELKHLPEFFRHAEANEICFEKREWRCNYCWSDKSICNKLIQRIDKLRVNPRSRKSVWNTKAEADSETRSKLLKLDLPPTRQSTSRKCYTCELDTCMFERQRRGELQFYIGSYNDLVNTYLWKVANLFMMHGKERNEIPNTGPSDTDCALIFKMLKNCNLFNNGGNTGEDYEDMLEVRNFLMHTFDHRLTKEALEECFERMHAILKQDQFCNGDGKDAIEELEKLKKKTIIMTSVKTEDIDFMRKAFSDQKNAVLQDIQIRGNVTQNPYVLEGVLKVNKVVYNRIGSQAGLIGAGAGGTAGAFMGSILGPPGAALGGLLGVAIGGFLGKLLE